MSFKELSLQESTSTLRASEHARRRLRIAPASLRSRVPVPLDRAPRPGAADSSTSDSLPLADPAHQAGFPRSPSAQQQQQREPRHQPGPEQQPEQKSNRSPRHQQFRAVARRPRRSPAAAGTPGRPRASRAARLRRPRPHYDLPHRGPAGRARTTASRPRRLARMLGGARAAAPAPPRHSGAPDARRARHVKSRQVDRRLTEAQPPRRAAVPVARRTAPRRRLHPGATTFTSVADLTMLVIFHTKARRRAASRCRRHRR